jgi:ABC-type Mn2+/Zn2+ transport system ATPase subunit
VAASGYHAVSINGGNFSQQDDKCLLKNINLRIKESSFVAVVGRVGAGKGENSSYLLGPFPTRKKKKEKKCVLLYFRQELFVAGPFG